jgi:hypothetical protein
MLRKFAQRGIYDFSLYLSLLDVLLSTTKGSKKLFRASSVSSAYLHMQLMDVQAMKTRLMTSKR